MNEDAKEIPARGVAVDAGDAEDPSASFLLVLSVEDRPRLQHCVRTLVTQAFAPRDVVVVTVSSAPDAIVLLRTLVFDLVISDYRLGASDGGQILRFLQDEQPTVVERFVFFTGSEEAEALGRTIDKGVRVETFVAELRRLTQGLPLEGAPCSKI